MTTSAAARCRGPLAGGPSVVATDLERFWPSRRSYAFDELCHPSAR